MIYYNAATKNSGPVKTFAPYDREANALFDDAKKRYASALFDLWNAPDKAEFERIMGALEQECNKAAQEVPTRLKPLVILPALLVQYLDEDIHEE